MTTPAAAPDQADPNARLRRLRDAIAARLTALFAGAEAVLAHGPVWIAAVIALLALQVALIATHRPWLDEWQQMQVALQSPDWPTLLVNLRYEGHPPLWYALLRAVTPLFADPMRALPVITLVIAVPVQLTILLAAPLDRGERLMIAASQFVLFEYLTLCRSLTLGFALMILIVALWRHTRLVWLMIALLPQCDFLFGVISLLFGAQLLRERRIDWPMAALWLLSSLIAAWSIRPMPDTVPSLVPRGLGHDFAFWMAHMSALGLPLQWSEGEPLWNYPPPAALGGLGLAGFVAVVWCELRARRAWLYAFAGFVALTLVFSLLVYQLSIRHLMLAAALLIVMVWRMAADSGHARSVWWRTWLLVAMGCGLFTAAINLLHPFDTAPEAAALIRKMGLTDRTWVPFPHSAGQSVAAINTMQFERLAQHCSEDMIRWNAPDDHRIEGIDGLYQRLDRKVAQDGAFYLLTWLPLPDHRPLLRRIAHVGHGYDGQDFYFYAVGEGHAPAHPHGQRCAAPLIPLRRG